MSKSKNRRQFEKRMEFYYEVFSWILENRKTLFQHETFDFPEYGGMPKKLSRKLSSEMVDRIQMEWYNLDQLTSMKKLCEKLLP